ncbi:flocculation protein FLO11-like [Venturia nashicola]|nr:flocculation protein FLO11-like [Venturia nashicola]
MPSSGDAEKGTFGMRHVNLLSSSEDSRAGQSSEESRAGQSSEDSRAGQSSEESRAGQSSEESRAGQSSEESRAGQSSEDSRAGQSTSATKSLSIKVLGSGLGRMPLVARFIVAAHRLSVVRY